MAESAEHAPVRLARHLGVFDATMIGVGAMIGAGIFVLTGMATGQAGPAAIIAFGLNGVVTLFTALSYAELSSAIPEAGGGYAFIKKFLPNWVAFLAGWMLWFAYVVACSLYARGFGSYGFEMLEGWMPALIHGPKAWIGQGGIVGVLTVAVGLFFLGVNVAGTSASGKAENLVTLIKIAILAVFCAFGLSEIGADPRAALAHFEPMFPEGWSGVLAAMGLTFIAFEGYDLIATVSEEIREPERAVPRAIMISLVITVAIYLLVVFVCIGAVTVEGQATWEFLGDAGEVGILRAAESFMPAFGVILVLAGGLFSTMSALNASVMASSRVAFSMGRDRMLPDGLGTLHPTRRTPIVALTLSGALFIILALFFPLETIGVATSLLFLLSFGLTNVALLLYRARHTGEPPPFQVPLFPLTPVLGVLTCAGLALFQLWAQPLAWVLSLGLIAVGGVLFVTFFSRKARMADVVATIEQPELLELKRAEDYKILVPVANPRRVEPLMQLATRVAGASQGRLLALSVVEVPEVTAYTEAGPFMEAGRERLAAAEEAALERGVPLVSLLTVGRDAARGIVDSAEENGCSLILMGYKSDEDPMENSVIHRVAVDQPCDVAILEMDEPWEEAPRRILVPVRGGDVHDHLKARVVKSVLAEEGGQVTLLRVAPAGTAESTLDSYRKNLAREAQAYRMEGMAFEVEASDDVAGTIARKASDHDLVVLGVRDEPWFRRFFFGTLTQQVASRMPCPTILTKTAAPGKSRLKKVMRRLTRSTTPEASASEAP